jgi:GPI ethanolamine phosphate transferase 3 subunit O
MQSRGLLLLLWVVAIHLAGIYLYTKGFLLTRLSLSDISTCSEGDSACTLPPSHKRAVLLIIDALRFDFLSPSPPSPPSPYHHNVLTLPAELTAEQPDRSFLFTSFADPPTTTLQRIKGITAGSLPTFVDMGSNFGGYSISEDSVIGQLHAAGKKVSTIRLLYVARVYNQLDIDRFHGR